MVSFIGYVTKFDYFGNVLIEIESVKGENEKIKIYYRDKTTDNETGVPNPVHIPESIGNSFLEHVSIIYDKLQAMEDEVGKVLRNIVLLNRIAKLNSGSDKKLEL